MRDWHEAMIAEIRTLEEKQTWDVVMRAPDDKLLHCKWVFKTKRHADGSLERFKARIVACGNEQEYGVNDTDTFSAALDDLSARLLLALLKKHHVPARHGDISNADVKAD
ncbi:hypothetical protein PC129_g14265 [Phytophthora cactorum]|uniref:Reverse transcriptase Ty1/copia-type domain-containing protein n=1 Tax=Phytophthora cactorum TaxID=29920 RepID=A0A329SZZ7_9STRA|nr:hypothetical protein Pcac1_g11693 [Phytophthora cactorum]KAG2844520.1 hypothetical protein PC112_g2179 [Phytophthora cactorum]KAG2846350.1 hypothetical protein PC111_g1228 [Phytophthora cactorum]KAG2868268.1 hypothetical protein PC113_g1222 [Phytophthora cactorum]KAG2933117.1 hypothetical protein PC114_g1565 [Phytophthora cactorum]